MSKSPLIQIYEHEALSFQEGRRGFHADFKEHHFEALVKYNEQNDHRFFTPIYRGIKFKQYVGVIQAGDLVIEILPKADRGDDKVKWRNVLLDMLKICRKIPLEMSSDAPLHLRHSNLMDIYLRIFLEETDKIIHKGLVKKYRRTSENQTALKGALQFSKHIQENLIHKERFFVQHQVYDSDHLLHQILNEALLLLTNISSNSDLVSKANSQLLYFSNTKRLKINSTTFSKIIYNRKTEHYQKAIEIAKLILLNFSPDIQKGQYHILAILFDMNRLWEEYLYRKLRKALGNKVCFQNRKLFWESRGIRPDIVIKDEEETYVIDAKWKVLYDSNPSDADLKQMYVYHQYWNAKKTFLVYPEVNGIPERIGKFHSQKGEKFQCQILFVNVLDDKNQNLNSNIGFDISQKITHP